jgi:mannosyltransferase OCH1-like enzyme
MIPKILWQTHECKYEDLPDLYKSNSMTWRNNFPDWEYRYHSAEDRENFIKQYYPELLFLYQFIKPGIYKADFWRYLVIYEFGGMYADMDSIWDPSMVNPQWLIDFDKPLNAAINGGFRLNKWTPPVYQNAWLLAESKNPVMKQVVDLLIEGCTNLYNYRNIDEPFPDSMWVHSTGPSMYTKVINRNLKSVHIASFPVEHGGQYKHESDMNPELKWNK